MLGVYVVVCYVNRWCVYSVLCCYSPLLYVMLIVCGCMCRAHVLVVCYVVVYVCYYV